MRALEKVNGSRLGLVFLGVGVDWAKEGRVGLSAGLMELRLVPLFIGPKIDFFLFGLEARLYSFSKPSPGVGPYLWA